MASRVLNTSQDGFNLLQAEIVPEEASRFPIRASEIFHSTSHRCVRPQYDPFDGLRVLVCFPSKKPLKNAPMLHWLQDLLRETLGSSKKITYDQFCYNVTDTGVGEQPFHSYRRHGGKVGAVQRIKKGLPEIQDMISDYHAVFFMSVESDIDTRDSPFFDKANIILFEYHSRYTAGVMSRGPSVQPELLELASAEKTYGKVLAEKFGIPPDDWHAIVCKDQKRLNSRTAFISDALNLLISRNQMENVFAFCLYAR
ncbi:hypothetical protein P170DRAFT_425447 [Aspergillus steynii IBT 23096]|uniref:Uncharacterized protein n=1 Tax=Aspergillus steynii IBT 23096 TaxID=1392250 RepID=A0A2I2GE63_9EURO|nr:uncharacterized protein P170DRAFT_425447 [Aspergillus steynii IBT 23096]PLB51188.1 hypothetical protein P170DRAFT_425447 [Aspergillus steynii IBT 23096]